MSQLQGLKSTLLKQDLALAKKFRMLNQWKSNISFDELFEEKENKKSKFQHHPRKIQSDEESDNESPVTEKSSASTINADLFKQKILKKAISNNLSLGAFNEIQSDDDQNMDEEEKGTKEATADLIFGGESLDFLSNYQKNIQDKQTKKYVENLMLNQAMANRQTKVRINEEKKIFPVRKKLKMSARKCSVVHKSDMCDSVFEKKFKAVTERIISGVNDICKLLEEGIAEPDGEEDFSRRNVRVREFSSRFVRNYLYPLNQQLKRFENKPKKQQNINQSLMTCYQLVFQGIQSFHNHLPTSVGNCASDKVKSLMDNALTICQIHIDAFEIAEDDDTNECSEYVYALKIHAEKLVEKIRNSFTARPNTNVKVTTPKPKKPNNMKMQSRYAMYTSSTFYRKDPVFRKALEQITKKKFNVKSRYKTATFKHRPPIEKNSDNLQPKSKLFEQRSSSVVNSTPLLSARIDDTVRTQIEISGSQLLTPANSVENVAVNQDEPDDRVLQLVQKEVGPEEEKVAKEGETRKVKEMLHEYFRNLEGRKILHELADQLQKEHERGETKARSYPEVTLGQANLERRPSSKLDIKLQSWKEPTVTVTGPKNAKLICITDDNPIKETVVNDKATCKTVQIQNQVEERYECNADAAVTDHKSKNSLKMNRLPKSGRPLKFLPDAYAINIIQYKLEFRKISKTNPLYLKTTNLQPWVLMGRLADDILDVAVLDVARDIEVHPVTEQIYKEEMQP
ncbi:uncharacterized protein LOC109608758 [Aethina tumida]|uniref:uncharacterized protein LOC109608758 n=1 Tax=Aethina tumida TaxID=116153 RepID=UPI00214895D7|nr:uncharacterized protein LOC109608758 [Aethina tumida]